MRQRMKKSLLLSFICAVILFILVISNDDNLIPMVSFLGSTEQRDISCYNEVSSADGLQEFDPNKDEDWPKQDNSIFFHETSCFGKEDGLLLNARQACAVESAARINPNMSVYLFFLSPSRIADSSRNLIRQLEAYNNIKIRRIYIDNYMSNTPLEEWYTSGILKTSRWPKSHMSDVLRYLTLWKYGGIYLDLDVVIIKSLSALNNFAGAEDDEDVAAGVMGFGRGIIGRKVAEACLSDLKRNFKGNIWGNNGPGVITRVLRRLCNTKYARDMISSRCSGFMVYPPSTFYPIHYKNWTQYFSEDNNNLTMSLLKNSRAIHVWNKFSKEKKFKVGSQVLYGILAEKYCPRVYSNCGKIF